MNDASVDDGASVSAAPPPAGMEMLMAGIPCGSLVADADVGAMVRDGDGVGPSTSEAEGGFASVSGETVGAGVRVGDEVVVGSDASTCCRKLSQMAEDHSLAPALEVLLGVIQDKSNSSGPVS